MPRYRPLTSFQTITPNLQRRRLLQAGAAVLCLGRTAIAWGAELVAVRVWPAKEYTRVTLESDQVLKWTQKTLQNPHRLLVDIEGLELSPTLRELVAKVTSNDPYIQQVRVGQNTPNVVRLVLDLKEPVLAQVFTLAPVGDYKNRLVFDLYPTTPIDPIVQMARAHELMAQQAKPKVITPSVKKVPEADDPIGDIARRQTTVTRDTPSAVVPPVAPPVIAQVPTEIPPVIQASPTPATAPVQKPTKVLRKAKHAPPPPPIRQHPPGGVQRLLTVMLDPGHGGEDPGATGPGGTHEKDVVLSIAKKLQAKILAQENMQASLTRDADYFVPLQNRVLKARQISADLFVSIHADAFVQPNARGASVFALSEKGASSTTARWLANKENAADLIGGVNVKSSDKQVAKVLLDLSTTAQIHDSKQVGASVLGQLSGFQVLHKNFVEQASFAVLKAPDIPSILIETAFISNPEEEVKLNNEAHQDRLAEAILKGIQDYFAKHPPLAKRGMV